jgi:hypothetical protein
MGGSLGWSDSQTPEVPEEKGQIGLPRAALADYPRRPDHQPLEAPEEKGQVDLPRAVVVGSAFYGRLPATWTGNFWSHCNISATLRVELRQRGAWLTDRDPDMQMGL